MILLDYIRNLIWGDGTVRFLTNEESKILKEAQEIDKRFTLFLTKNEAGGSSRTIYCLGNGSAIYDRVGPYPSKLYKLVKAYKED